VSRIVAHLSLKKIVEFMEFRDSIGLFTTASAMSHPEPDESSTKSTTANEYYRQLEKDSTSYLV